MNEITAQLLRRFFKAPHRMSRNRNFHAFLDPRVRSASRAGRLLSSLRDDLLAVDVDAIAIHDDGASGDNGCVVIELTYENGFRKSYLSHGELRILREDRRVDVKLRSLDVDRRGGPTRGDNE